ncbi:MAG TPA: HEAT repeat domain-containing protein [Gemmatimonadales bacterium]|nr:HEAT repeat domain-containing protein [Gemmatimonadales bacterium]
MQTMLLVVAVMAMQQPASPRRTFEVLLAPQLDALTIASDRLEGLQGLAGLEGLAGLAGLEGLEGLQGLSELDGYDMLDAVSPPAFQDAQDPTDSLWRAARQAFNRGDYTSAANLYGDLMRRYPNATRAGDALYWAAFALYKNDNLDRPSSLLVDQARQYPKAATLRDAAALLARVQTALARQGDEDAARWVRNHAQPADTTRAASCPTEDDEDDMRVAALNGLLQMDAANALPILKKVLARRDACSAGLRRKAVFLVSQKRSAETEDILLDVAQHDPDSEVRQQAVFWLSQVPTDRAVGMLDSILKTATDQELQEKAIFALSQQHSPRAGAILRAYAERADAPSETREKAIFWLGQQHSTDNAEFLRALYPKLTEEDLKEKVIFSLAQMGGAENMRWMMDLAVNEREPVEMRKKALFWAGQSGADLGQLATLYDRMQNREMKEQLIFVYSQRHEAAALDALIKIAKTEQDRELRKKAIFWLGQSHDPRAAQVLLEIINQ